MAARTGDTAVAPHPVTAHEFSVLIGDLGPFEAQLRLGLAVSGGADSMALTFLAEEWARQRGGAVCAFTVDHGMRPGSAEEASEVGAILSARGIEHHILTWRSPRGERRQAAARAARYALLESALRKAGILHLLLGHTADDQAETVLLRREAKSGADGLAGMPAIRELRWCRLLRPLLPVRKERLVATCQAAGVRWMEDPSNRDPRFARIVMRQRLAARPAIFSNALADAAQAAADRRRLEAEIAEALARHVAFPDDGGATVSRALLSEAVGVQALGRLLRAIGGNDFLPPNTAVAALVDRLRAGAPGGTLAHCRVRNGPIISVTRERDRRRRRTPGSSGFVEPASPTPFAVV